MHGCYTDINLQYGSCDQTHNHNERKAEKDWIADVAKIAIIAATNFIATYM